VAEREAQARRRCRKGRQCAGMPRHERQQRVRKADSQRIDSRYRQGRIEQADLVRI